MVSVAVKRCTKCEQEKPATGEFFAVDKRLSTGLFSWCRECQREDARRRRQANPEKARECQRASHQHHREERLASLRNAYRQRMANPETASAERERARLKARREREHDPEKVRGRVRKSRARNVEKVRARAREQGRERYAENPEIFRARTAKQRAKRRKVEGGFDGHDLHAAFKRQGGKCLYCHVKVGRGLTPWHADHFIPLSRGGSNDPSNIVVACEPCNRQKYNKMPWEFMPEKFPPPQQSH